jgi:malate dehydrogenase (oxaloacetate-decarboxylating)(NADP+)
MNPRPGKIEVIPSKPMATQHDLSLAYTPGVAIPCLEIQSNPETAKMYTAKGNLVAVISNGTAVLGLGNIGALAGKPVMEGKGVLFKKFADIDVFDIEVNTEDAEEFINTVKNIAPTFGGINLEDIKAPECFLIEERLKKELDIPVFHDDQHGTAIISGAALINATELVGKKLNELKLVVSGAGAAGIACANFYVSLGVTADNILMTDSKGVLWKGRGDEGRNKFKDEYFRETKCRTLADAMKGADVFCGLSIKNILSQDMIRTMADNPIIFAMANPDPEISYPDAIKARKDIIMATGRSDYPNQVNNVLGFPFIFRGTLDVNASDINEEMKIAAATALAELARQEVPMEVKNAYQEEDLKFGPDYIIPKPVDGRVLIWTASAVAEAAMITGVARKKINIEEYKEQLEERLDPTRDVMRKFHVLALRDPKRIVFPEGNNEQVIWAASNIVHEGIAKPILLTKDKKELKQKFIDLHHDPSGIEIIEPKKSAYMENYVDAYYKKRQRKGLTRGRAKLDLRNYYNFATMMVDSGHADALIAGLDTSFPSFMRSAIQMVGMKENSSIMAGMYMLHYKNQLTFFADCAVNINPSDHQLSQIALLAAAEIQKLGIEPRIGMLSFSNFGSVRTEETNKISRAVELVKNENPALIIDGPIQPDIAFSPKLKSKFFPFCELSKRPNLLIFPTLDAGNISLNLLKNFSNARHIGPIMIGLNKPIHFVTRGSDVNHIIDMAAIASVDAQE